MKPYYEHGGITIYCGDSREVLPHLAPDRLDWACITDPPWGINYDNHRVYGDNSVKWKSRKNFNRVKNDDRPFDPKPLTGFGGGIAIWGGNNFASSLPDSGGWLVWDKKRGATLSRGFIGSDAELAWTNRGKTVRMFPYMWNGLCRDGEVGDHLHPTQKPIALMRWTIAEVSDSEKVIDPYMGSGTTLIAAKQLGRGAVGIELEERYCEIAAKRLSQEVFDFPTESWFRCRIGRSRLESETTKLFSDVKGGGSHGE